MKISKLLARVLGTENGNPAQCEALEARALMTAPTATIVAHNHTVEDYFVTIRYEAPEGINLSTIDGNDMGVVRVQGEYGRLGAVDNIAVQQNGAVDVRYRVSAYEGHWHWMNTGNYRVGIAANQVRSNNGDGNAGGGLASYWFVWSNPRVQTTITAQPGTGLPSWTIRVTPATWAPAEDRQNFIYEFGNDSGYLNRVVAPLTPSTNGTYLATGGATAPGGSWDHSDTNRYFLRHVVRNLGQEVGVINASSWWLWFGGPRATVLGTNLTEDRYTVTVRFDSPRGINLSTLGNAVRMDFSGPAARTRPMSLFGSPVVAGDGSVTATYQLTPQSEFGFSWYENGPYSVQVGTPNQPGAIEDGGGFRIAHQTFATGTFDFRLPPIVNVGILGENEANITVGLNIATVYSMSGTLDLADFIFSGPAGQTPALSFVRSDIGYGGFYSIEPSQAGGTLLSGVYTLRLRAGALTGYGQPSAEVLLGSWTFEF